MLNIAQAEEWRKGFNAFVGQYIIGQGDVVDKNEDTYGWRDYKATQHGKKCGLYIDSDATVKEDTVYEFQDSFAENTDEAVLEVSPVNCHCGQIEDRTVRVKADLSDVIGSIFRP